MNICLNGLIDPERVRSFYEGIAGIYDPIGVV